MTGAFYTLLVFEAGELVQLRRCKSAAQLGLTILVNNSISLIANKTTASLELLLGRHGRQIGVCSLWWIGSSGCSDTPASRTSNKLVGWRLANRHRARRGSG
jgi:hypothetical protein